MKTIFQTSAFLTICLAFFTGCAHPQRHYNAPNRAAVVAASTKLRSVISQAKATSDAAQRTVNEAKSLVETQSATISADKEKLAALFQNAPVELRAEIAAVQAGNESLRTQNAALAAKVCEAQDLGAKNAALYASAIPQAEAELEKANDLLYAEAAGLADKANVAEAGWTHDSRKLVANFFSGLIGKLVIILFIGTVVVVLILIIAARVSKAA